MRSVRRSAVLVVVATFAAVSLGSCTRPMVVATEVDESFADGGVLTVGSVDGLVRVAVAADGGLFTYDTASRVVARVDAAGEPVAGWAPPTMPAAVEHLGALPDGSLAATFVEGGSWVLARWDATGARVPAATRPLANANLRSYGTSAGGSLAIASSSCAAGVACDGTVVQVFRPDGSLRYATTVSTAVGGGSTCSASTVVRYVRAHDDGGATLAMVRCIPAGASERVVALRLLPDGSVDPDYGAGAGFARLLVPAVRIVVSEGGEVLGMTGSYTASRLTPDGEPDTTFGTRTATQLAGGQGILSIIANGDGYTLSSSPSGPGCAPTGTTPIRHIDAAGQVRSTVSSPVVLGGGSLQAWPNGDLLVYGTVQTALPQPGGGVSCVAPRTSHHLKLVPAPTDPLTALVSALAGG